jgi:UDP-2-acetamido-3-amino-2,3-dideoxy-glucuronate N-acetyltransferase
MMRERTQAQPIIHPPSIVQEGAVLGRDTVVGAFCFIASGARIGAGTRIQSHTSVWDGVELGEDVFVGPSATFTNVRRPRVKYPRARGAGWDRTLVGDGATIGASATLVAPVRIGAGAMIGAGAVVVRDVPAHALVVGNPSVIIGFVCACGERISTAPESARCTQCATSFEPDGTGGLRPK